VRAGRMLVAVVVAAGLAPLLAGCGSDRADAAPGTKARPTASHVAASPKPSASDGRIAGVSAHWLARIPAATRQVVVAYGNAADSPSGQVTFYQKQGSTWTAEATWPSHNGRAGWTTAHHENDQHSPVGVFTLSDAGGLLPDPGSRLPYNQTTAFTPLASWGPSRRHDFDYVIAIDYNRVTGNSPLDPRRPRGESAGGGIWLHMDHGSGSSACVTLPKTAMQTLLRTLDPAQRPVVVMGDRATLARGTA
jgi:L,D-peptidoglycan transpeptidase YkuD (ErfK/YbiS/YcfS/YnhG family)